MRVDWIYLAPDRVHFRAAVT